MAQKQRNGSRVLAIQHVAAEPPSGIGSALEATRVGLDVVRVDLGQPVPPDLGEAAGLVIMGGPMGVYEMERYPHLSGEITLIRDALARDLPILGICLGSQLLASALGARVYASCRKEIGWHPVHLTSDAAADPLFTGLPSRFSALHWHGDVFELPSGAVPLAFSAMTAPQAFRYGRTAYGLLFHLEVSPGQVRAMASAFPDELAAVGLTISDLDGGTARHLEQQRRLGDEVFVRWASLCRRPAPGLR